MKLIRCVMTSVALVISLVPAQAELPSATPAATSESSTAFAALLGRWVRPDGGYVISIKSVDASGKLEATYANPNPLPFQSAIATNDRGALKLNFELQAGGYNGSTYTLTYDVAGDRLQGTYYQAVAKQTFAVIFLRK